MQRTGRVDVTALLLSFPKNALTMATAIFCYEKLDARNRGIRVCVLQPGNISDALSCILRTVSLNEDPCYEALSYVLGDPNLTKQINANGSTNATTESLHTAHCGIFDGTAYLG